MEFIFAIALLLMVTGCRKISCERFDLEHEMMVWHFFPELEEEYNFINIDSNLIVFNQFSFERNELEEHRCHMCACQQNLILTYKSEQNNISLENNFYYDSLDDGWVGMSYLIDGLSVNMDLENGIIVKSEYVSENNNQSKFEISNLQNYDLLGTSFDNLVQFEVQNSSLTEIEKFWIQKGKGIVGLQIQNQVWLKE